MIGFIATLEIIEDLGPLFYSRWFHRTIQVGWIVVVYVIALLAIIRMLRIFGTTYSWTANALRDGMLIFVSIRFKNRPAFMLLLGLVILSFWPYWNYNMLAFSGFIGTLGVLMVLNLAREWILAHWWRLGLAIGISGALFWLFNMYAYHYDFDKTVSVIICFIMVMMIAQGYDRLLKYRKDKVQDLMYDTEHDRLTGIWNREKFEHDFDRYQQLLATREVPAVYLVMIDIDHFKPINDQYGHLVGDQVLKTFARSFCDYLKTSSIAGQLYRTGGEEFSLLVAGEVSKEDVRKLITDYQQQLKAITIHRQNTAIQLTISAGITAMLATDHHRNVVIERADNMLYAAKRAGRDRVLVDG